ncbi:MAG: DUF4856 domain-containing protein [Myxococcota bacterium]
MQLARLSVLTLAFAACTGSDDDDTPTDIPVELNRYAFDGRTGESSVAYSGQVMRQLLIDDLQAFVTELGPRIDAGFAPAPGSTVADMEFYLSFDGETSGAIPHSLVTDPAPLQLTYGEVSDKNLWGKLAGNDEVGQHKDWSTDFVGWGDHSPESLVRQWMQEIDDAAAARANGVIPTGADGAPIASVALSADGVDRAQLLGKFLRNGIAYSQGADDYLDDDTPGKGLLADHTELSSGSPYTELEHAWDEGFGYYGATRNGGTLSAEQVADTAFFDDDDDGKIDLTAEVAWGHSRNAAKRDTGAEASTSFYNDAWAGFVQGRDLLDQTDAALTDAELAELQGYRDQALEGWEAAIASTAVHYINDVLQDMSTFDSQEYDFASHAKHWSELKGFSLGLQFNPRSRMSDSQFAELQTRIGERPTLPSATSPERDAYVQDLLAAREILGQAYGFDAANLGDDNGLNGW